MEQTRRIAKWFEAENDEEAREKAHLIHLQTDGTEYEGGDTEYDYALCDDEYKDLVYWD